MDCLSGIDLAASLGLGTGISVTTAVAAEVLVVLTHLKLR
jgi:hypothetical protein